MIVFFSLATDLLQYSLESTLALKLHSSFGFSRPTIGLYFGVFLLGTVVLGLAGIFFPEEWEKRKIVILLLWVNVAAPLLIGPSKVLHLPNNHILIGIGLFLGGSTRSLLGTYIVTEGVKGALAQFPGQETRVGDILSSLYNSGQALTLFLSPVFGSSVMDAVGFERTMEIEAALFLVNALIFTVYTVSDLRREKEEKRREALRGDATGESEDALLLRKG